MLHKTQRIFIRVGSKTWTTKGWETAREKVQRSTLWFLFIPVYVSDEVIATNM